MKALLFTLCLCLSVSAGELENLLKNEGFETLSGGVPSRWSIPGYWSGAMTGISGAKQAKAGQRCLKLSSVNRQGRHWGRVLYNGTFPVSLGRPMAYRAWVRGRGQFLLGIIRYTKVTPGKPHYHYLWQEPALELTDDWQQAVLEFRIDEPQFLRFACVAEVRGENAEVFVDEIECSQNISPGITWTVSPLHPMVAAGTQTQITFTVRKDGAEVTAGDVSVISFPVENEPLRQTVPLTDVGAVFSYTAPLDADGLQRLVFLHPETGAAEEVAVDVLPLDRFAEFEAAAAGIAAPPTPWHLLFLGDSLTDFHRGSNYVDKIGFWLGCRFGDTVTVKNAGVGGDFITRMWDRLDRKKGTHRLEMYDELLEPKPNHIFIFLGHNDSKASSTSDYTRHTVDPETFDEFYRKTIAKLRADSGAAITILSASSSVYEITKASAEKSAAAGRAHNLFGKPEHLEAFNAIARKVAEDMECDFLDVYTPTRDHPDKPALFMADGVHVNNEGNRLLALLLLEHMRAPAVPAGEGAPAP